MKQQEITAVRRRPSLVKTLFTDAEQKAVDLAPAKNTSPVAVTIESTPAPPTAKDILRCAACDTFCSLTIAKGVRADKMFCPKCWPKHQKKCAFKSPTWIQNTTTTMSIGGAVCITCADCAKDSLASITTPKGTCVHDVCA